MKRVWKVVNDCNTKDDIPTCWVRRINHPIYGKFVWISQYDKEQYVVEVIPEVEEKVLTICKSLSSAKRWVARNIN